MLVVGNSGSGKSTLATEHMDQGLAHLDLDLLAWLDTEPPTRRPRDEVEAVLRAFVSRERSWVVEGCYADLLALVADQATELVFLDRDVATCQAHARQRPWEPHKYASKQAQDAKLDMLLAWIATYPDREGPLGRAAHVALYESFDGDKRRVR